ncbi:hypothetical protein AMS68_004328 [Peltaster fructicola]|uniref:CBM20 domain-containing protein n=1 Tax=Peltaster fructicola TaxID=286661 RepID=A0A6H0XVX3_9PEZI|nr:hypothetical protein AMS68_004328 [Peltaster fructicola]
MHHRSIGGVALLATATVASVLPRQASIDSCPGYKASNVQQSDSGLTADLTLAGTACNVYGTDLTDLTLTVEYQSDDRLHVKIQDQANQVYQVPDSVFDRPSASSVSSSNLQFNYTAEPFSFTVSRNDGEVLFDSSAASLIFEDQYIRLRTKLPDSPSLYGLGESTDPFMLKTVNYTRTFWNRDAYTVPPGTNLYGDHRVYFDHRANGTHGVFLLNSDGMDIKIDTTGGQHLEYNGNGGVFDLYFLAGSTPVQVAQQYSEVVGKSAMMPYWGLGFHQCRYGMQDVFEVAEVVANYSAADIPLETMWTDIDYMYLRRVFSLDPLRFPLQLVRDLVSTLHDRQQHYIVMVDPAVAYQDYPPFNDGVSQNAFLKVANGSVYKGVVWPGVTAFPDWFAPGTQSYWNYQFQDFFNPDSGVDIDALWIDMNEASNFCDYPCSDPEGQARSMGDPPRPPPVRLGSPRPIAGFGPEFQPPCQATIKFSVNATTFFGENIYVLGSASTLGGNDPSSAVILSSANWPLWQASLEAYANSTITYQYLRGQPDGSFLYENQNRTITTGTCDSYIMLNDTITTASPPHKLKRRDIDVPVQKLQSRQSAPQQGLPGRNLLFPAYQIQNAAGGLSEKTLNTDLVHANGLVEYDTHDLYGAMMSEASRIAMLSRRPTRRPLIITRSTFAGSGRQVGKWLGDNVADWEHYLFSVAGLLQFGALFQVPMVGSDVCGYAGGSNDLLCARWATLGAFSVFYRNHGEQGSPPHEFYRYPTAAAAARNAIATRYQLIDYIYTALYNQNQTGTPVVQPMFFQYPSDGNTNSLQYQYFYGPSILVAPVIVENSTVGSVYLPNDIFYDFYTHEVVRGTGETIVLPDVPYTTIPLYYKGGSIVALRAASANTTTELRKQDFVLVVAPDDNGNASGDLYLDDGDSIVQPQTSYIQFTYSGNKLCIYGTFNYDAGVVVKNVTVLGDYPMTHTDAIPLTGQVDITF